MKPNNPPDAYLGDGVYASYDGYHIWLDLRAQGDPHVRIALEPAVMAALDRFRALVREVENLKK